MYDKFGYINFNGIEITDISKQIKIISQSDIYGTPIYKEYIIDYWESPENIAYNFYGSCDDVWAILVINDIVNPFSDWLMKPDELIEYIKDKYGEEHINDIHHYEKNDIIYSTNEEGSVPITNFQYESDLNEKRRKIKIIRPELLSSIKESIEKLL